MSKRQKASRLHTRSMVSVPFPVDDGKKVVRAALVEGVSVSGFIRSAAVDKADRVLARQERDSARAEDVAKDAGQNVPQQDRTAARAS